MQYLVVKTVHQTAVVLSVIGFFARGWGSLRGQAWVTRRSVKTVPHVVDTVLLVSALALAWMLGLSPVSAPWPPWPSWLMAKIAGLLVYIVLGMLALRPGRPTGIRAAAWIAALATFGWIVSVAISKHPAGFFAIS